MSRSDRRSRARSKHRVRRRPSGQLWLATALCVAGALVPVSCGSSPSVGCATTDVPLAHDVATATHALEVAAEAIGLGDAPTDTEQRSFQEGAPAFSLESGGGQWMQTQVSRSELVDFVDIRPAVAALEDEGFEQEPSRDAGMTTYILTRRDQRASVSLGDRLRGNHGQIWATIRVDTGCHLA